MERIQKRRKGKEMLRSEKEETKLSNVKGMASCEKQGEYGTFVLLFKDQQTRNTVFSIQRRDRANGNNSKNMASCEQGEYVKGELFF